MINSQIDKNLMTLRVNSTPLLNLISCFIFCLLPSRFFHRPVYGTTILYNELGRTRKDAMWTTFRYLYCSTHASRIWRKSRISWAKEAQLRIRKRKASQSEATHGNIRIRLLLNKNGERVHILQMHTLLFAYVTDLHIHLLQKQIRCCQTNCIKVHWAARNIIIVLP
jgi:hypothetical protein